MKKLMTIALAATFAASAFAQNPDALKQIKKTKNYSEAQSLIKSNEQSMTAAENAQAYAKLVDISYSGISKTFSTIQTNQAMQQMGQSGESVDLKAFCNDLCTTITDAITCDKYDVQPNDKGKVAPKFRKSNGDRLMPMRLQLITAGQEAQDANDMATAEKFYGMYVTSGAADLFQDAIAAQAKLTGAAGDPYLTDVARVATYLAFQAKDYANASKYADVFMQDQEKFNEALQFKLVIMQQDLKTREDSVKCLNELKDMYAKYPENEDVFGSVAQMYANLGMSAEQNKLVEEALAKNPNCYTAWAMKGQNAMTAQNYDEALENYKKAADCPVADEKRKSQVYTFIGFCLNTKAGKMDNYDQQIALVKEGIPYLEKAKELDPQREVSNWAYPLYQSYYNVYGENDPKTQELKVLLGY